MKKVVNYLLYIIIVVLLSTDIYLQVTKAKVDQPAGNVEERVKALEEKCNGLQLEMEDVKNVQGYIVWERDWRNKERTR